LGITIVGAGRIVNGAQRAHLSSDHLVHNEPREQSGHGLHLTSNNKKLSKEKTMSNQESCKPHHTDEQKPGSEQKSGSLPSQPVQQKQENLSGEPKSPQSEQEKHEQEKKKQA
jgi:hypothetical protein